MIPPGHAEEAGRLMGQHEQLFCSLDTEGGPGMGGVGPHGIAGYRPDDGRIHLRILGQDR